MSDDCPQEKSKEQLVAELESVSKELKTLKSQFNSVYDHHYQLTGLIDREGRLLMANKTALAFIGAESHDVIGKEFWRTPWWTHSSEEQRKLREGVGRALKGEMVRFETTHTNEAGEARTFDFRISPALDENAEVVYLVPEGYDITDRKLAEEALRKNEEKYRTFFEKSCDPMLMIRDGFVIDCNPAVVEALGCQDASEVINLHVSVFSPEFQPDGSASCEKSREMTKIAYNQGTHRFEWEHERKDGTTFPVEVSITAIPSEGEKILLAVWRDIEDRKRSEHEILAAKDKAETANRAKDEFLAVMSHEMRTPLNPIMGYSSLLLNRASEEDSEMLQSIYSSGERLLRLIDQILGFLQLDRSQVTLKSMNFQLVEICKMAYETIKPDARELDYQFVNGGTGLAPIDENITVLSDSDMLLRLLENLLQNACKYTHSGSVTFAIGHAVDKDKENTFQFTIEDTGIGMDEATLARAFDAFTQADSSYTRPYEGVGLGLAICDRLVNLLGGSIEITSKLGAGSCFSVTLPLKVIASNAEDTQDKHRKPLKADGLEKPLHVLVVEDDLGNAKLIETFVKCLGGEPSVALNGYRAVQLCEQQTFDAVFMDILMPGMNGFETTARIKAKDKPNSTTPVIALTANVLQLVEDKCYAANMVGFLKKPISIEEFRAALYKAVSIN